MKIFLCLQRNLIQRKKKMTILIKKKKKNIAYLSLFVDEIRAICQGKLQLV